MNNTDDNLNKSIEDNLRLAHQEVQCHPEWAAQVLSQISSELKRVRDTEASLANDQPNRMSDSRSWPRTMALAAGLLLAALGFVLLTRSMNRSSSNDAAESLANNSTPRRPTDTIVTDAIIPDAHTLNSAPMDTITQNSRSANDEDSPTDSVDSVTAGTGYLVSKLSSEAEFEIYVVLPTMPINVAGNTK